jgi:hypothetical protein
MAMRRFTGSRQGRPLLAIAGVLLVLGSIQGAAAWLAQDRSQYVDPQFGFSFGYPPEWRSVPGAVVDPYTYVWETQIIAPGDAYRAVTVSVQPLNAVGMTAEAWAAEVVGSYNVSLNELEQHGAVSRRTVGGVPAISVDVPGDLALVRSTYFTADGFGTIISLLAEDTAQFSDGDLAVYNALLDSFTMGHNTPSIEKRQGLSGAAAAAVAETFQKPLTSSIWQVDFDVHPSVNNGVWSGCLQAYWQNLWHAAEDWGVAAGTTVRAVANGQVSWYNPNYSTYPGRVVIVRHTLPDSSTIYSVYSHLGTVAVTQGQDVSKGQTIGTILDQGGNSHLHWEMRTFADGTNLCNSGSSIVAGPGYTYPAHATALGYVDPTTYVNTHAEGYEPDNNSGQAKRINSGEAQTHSIIPATDHDWVKFTLDQTSGIVLETSGADPLDDTRLWLYDGSLNEIDYHDDISTNNLNSRIERLCGVDALPAGTYYAHIDEFNNNRQIASYQLNLTTNVCGVSGGINMVTNGSLEDNDDPTPLIPDDWTAKGLNASDQLDCASASDGVCSFTITGTGKGKKLTQTVNSAGTAGSYSLRFDARGAGVGGSGKFLLKVEFVLGNGNKKTYTVKVTQTGDFGWTEFGIGPFSVPSNYSKIIVTVQYSRTQGVVWFDDVVLVRN